MGAPVNSNLLDLYRTMRRIRTFEERVGELLAVVVGLVGLVGVDEQERRRGALDEPLVGARRLGEERLGVLLLPWLSGRRRVSLESAREAPALGEEAAVGHGRGAEDSISVSRSRRISCQGPLP